MIKIFCETFLGQIFTLILHIKILMVQCVKVLTGLNLVSILRMVGCCKQYNKVLHFINVKHLLVSLESTNFSNSLIFCIKCLHVRHIWVSPR
jgi:hypothetical protein